MHLANCYRSYRAIAAFGAIALMIGTYVYYKKPAVGVSEVEGAYRSDACPTLSIKAGYVLIGNQKAKLRLINDKFGLQGWILEPISVFYTWEQGKKVPSIMLFDDERNFSILRVDRTDCRYRRVGST